MDNDFESMYHSVTDTVRDMDDLKELFQSEMKGLRDDIYKIVKNCEIRVSILEDKVDIWERVRFICAGGVFGILVTVLILFIMGII